MFGFKALKALRLEDMRIPLAYVKTFQGPAHGIVMEREYLNKYGRPLLGATTKPKLGLSARNYGRVVYEALRGGLDFTKDDENINSQPFMRWRDRYLFTHGGGQPGRRRETGEIKGHYLNVTAATMEDMYERAEFAKELGSVIVMVDLTVGYTAHPVDVQVGPAQRGHPAPAPGRPRHLHPAEDARGQLPGHRQVDAADRGGPHPRRHRGRQAGGRPDHGRAATTTRCAAHRCRPTRAKGLYFDQDWGSMPGTMPVASGGIHAGQMHQLLHYLGEDVVLQFGGGTIGHPMGIAAGATANRVARRGDDQGPQRGPRLPAPRASRSWPRRPSSCQPLQMALDTWGDITFNYESTDTPDVVATPTA